MTVVAPRSKDDLTAEWLTSILREEGVLGDGASVEEVAVEDVGVGRGYICQTVRVTPTYAGPVDGAPVSMVAKVPTFVDFGGELAEMMGRVVAQEHAWYREEQPGCPLRTPKSFGSVMESIEAHALLLEDFGGLAELAQMGGCPAETARLIVPHLAAGHAHWWEASHLRAAAWLPSAKTVAREITPPVRAGWQLFAERLLPGIDASFAPLGERLMERYAEVFLDAAASASTLVHGDFRLENLLFGEAGTPDELVVIDWQLISFGSGLRDMAYFVSQSLRTETRREIEQELIELYYGALVEHGVSDYSRAQCEPDYRRGLLTAMSIPMLGALRLAGVAEPAADAGAEAWADYRAVVEGMEGLVVEMASRSIAAIEDNGAGELVESAG
jgi:hypothetical protein